MMMGRIMVPNKIGTDKMVNHFMSDSWGLELSLLLEGLEDD